MTMAPREIEDGSEIDSLVPEGFEDVPYDKLMEMLGDDEKDIGAEAFGTGEDKTTAEPAVVSVEDGIDLIEGAQSGKRKSAKVEDAPVDPAPAKTDEAPADSAPDALDVMLTGMDDATRTLVKARVTAADEVMAVFKGRESELESLGTTPHAAMAELVKINSYARSKPDEYLAWAASQFGDPAVILGKAAERFGFKLVASDEGDDGDPFEDTDTKAMRVKLAAYEAREKAPILGPDAPQNRIQQDLTAWQQKAPHFKAVAPQIAALAKAHVETSGIPATIADIQRFYDAAVSIAGLTPAAVAPPAQSTFAAQSAAPVAQPAQKTTAAPSDSVQRAKAASKSLDGSGQGAGRRPAISPDASLDSVLSTLYDEQSKR